MARLDPALWRDMMAYLRRKHAPICRQWFEELQPVALDAGLLKIHVGNDVRQNYLQHKCLEPFTEAAQAATGALIAVRFTNAPLSPLSPLSPPLPPLPPSSPHPLHSTASAAAFPASAASPLQSHLASAAPAFASANHVGAGLEHHPSAIGVPHQTAHPNPAPTRPPQQLGHHHPVPSLPAEPALPGEFTPAAAGPHDHQDAGTHGVFEPMILSPDYAFENFVPGPGNQLAYAAAVAVANQPGTAYNPLFIHGGVGLGKTHLLQAICQGIIHKNPSAKICYLSCDAFINQFLDCVQKGLMDQFRHRYRHVDVLVIDDIHFLANRERTQEEFFHTFNELHQARKQIVLSSDAAPNEIPQLEERLVSRFQWGLVAHVSKPEFETRMAIVKAKAKLRGMDLPDEVISYIAQRIDSNARELEGALTTLQGHAMLENRSIDLSLAQKAMGETITDVRSNQVTLQNIIDVVTAYYDVKLSDLQSKRRHKSITLPRQVCMWLARKRTRYSLQEIGAYFGGRDHTTVMHSIQTIDQQMQNLPVFAQQLAQMDDRITRPAMAPIASPLMAVSPMAAPVATVPLTMAAGSSPMAIACLPPAETTVP